MTPCPTCGAKRDHRSKQSHDHFFAAVQAAFDNLPENMGPDFASAEHLRKWALIRAGYRNERIFVAETNAEALRVAAFARQMDDYALIVVRGNTISAYTAKSQSLRAMGKAEFQRSKDLVLTVLAKLIGIDVADLRNAKAA